MTYWPAAPPSTPDRAIVVAATVLAVIAGVAGLFALEWVLAPIYPGGPSLTTPVGTALTLSNGTGICPVGNGTSPKDCWYAFSVQVAPPGQGPTPTPNDLSFRLWNSSGAPLSQAFLVVIVNQFGSWMSSWNSTTSSWTGSANGGTCGSTGCVSAPLETGDALEVHLLPNGGLPLSGQGDQLIASAVGGGFGGYVAASIN